MTIVFARKIETLVEKHIVIKQYYLPIFSTTIMIITIITMIMQ